MRRRLRRHTPSTRTEGIDEQLCQKHDRQQARARVESALEAINQRYAKAIRLRVLQDRPREECAAELGVTVPTFDVVLHRALKAMKKAVTAQSPVSVKSRDDYATVGFCSMEVMEGCKTRSLR